jgi:hypothetical protein
MPGIGEEMEGAMQQAPHPGLQEKGFNGELWHGESGLLEAVSEV